MEFGFSTGALAFISLAILLIIYLIRPRAKDMTIPSLMFIIKESGRSLKSSFLEKLLRNLILLLQIIALSALALAIMQPLITMSYDSAAANTVIVIDISASMGAHDGKRFSEAVDLAKSSLKGDVSIVAAGDFPVLLLEKGSASKAKSILSQLTPRDMGTNIGDAMLLSKDLLHGEEGRVIVLSDFAYSSGPDPNVVRKIIEADGAVVDMVKVGTKGDNAGIIDLVITRYDTTVFIKNYNDADKDITASVINHDHEKKKVSISLPAHSVSSFSFQTLEGETEVRINEDDDLMSDNTAFISAPESADIKVLIITNSLNIYLKKALESSKDIAVQVAEPPIIPKFDDFDVVIMGAFDSNKILTGTLNDLESFAGKGRAVIVTANSESHIIDYGNIIPVRIIERVDQALTNIHPSVSSGAGLHGFGESLLEFGTTNQYFVAEAENSSVVYAVTSDNNPVIVTSKRGQGTIAYYGIIDLMATFKSSPSYPLFWTDLVSSLAGSESINSFNYPAGRIILFDEPVSVKTPSGSVRTDRLLLDRAGFYTFNDRTISANLLSAEESDINHEIDFDTKLSGHYSADAIKKKKDVNIESYLIILALLALIAEMIIVKYRGDL